jgi:hypothetical protein
MKKLLPSGDLLVSQKNSEKSPRPNTDIGFFEGFLIGIPICFSLWCAGYLYISFAF